MFWALRAHHQENLLYQCHIWYLSLCVDDRLVCRVWWAHNTRNMQRIEMNKQRKIVHQLRFIYKLVSFSVILWGTSWWYYVTSNHVIANDELAGAWEGSSCGIFWELFGICVARWWQTTMQIQSGYSLIILLCFCISILNCVWMYWYSKNIVKNINIYKKKE
jgi:hypothetical protein